MEGEAHFAQRWGARFEARLYRLCGIDAAQEMTWLQYAGALLLFNLAGTLLIYALQRCNSGCR